MSTQQTSIVTSSEMIKTVLALEEKISNEDMRNLFQALLIDDLDGKMQFRPMFAATILAWHKGVLDAPMLEQFRNKLSEVLEQARVSQLPGQISNEIEILPSADNQPIAVVGVGQNRTLDEIAPLFGKSQAKRFVEENFSASSLDYLYDSFTKPADYQTGTLAKLALRVVQKVATPSRVLRGLAEQIQFTWVDDGLESNKSLEIFLNKKKIEEENAKRSTKMGM